MLARSHTRLATETSIRQKQLKHQIIHTNKKITGFSSRRNVPHSPRSVFVLLCLPESSHPRRYRYHLLEKRENYLQAVSEDKINSGSIRLLMYDDFNDFLYILLIIDFSN